MDETGTGGSDGGEGVRADDGGGTGPDDDGGTGPDDDGGTGPAYRGVPGAFPYAWRVSQSHLFSSYVLAGGLLALFVLVVFAAGLLQVIAATAGAPGGTLTLARGFFVLVGLLAGAPLLGPVLAVARRHRRGRPLSPRQQAGAGLLGYGYVLGLYVGLVVSAPDAFEADPSGPAGPVVGALNALPEAASPLFPLAAVAAMVLAWRAAD